MGMRAVGVVATFLLANPATARVWLVCNSSSYPCPRGAAYKAVSSAIARAGPGDWVLVWPGVYHEKGGNEAGVLITTPGVHLRGMDRNLVVVDGSDGTATTPCPAGAALQDLTPRNGIEAFKVSGTSIENLTVCNYLSSTSGKAGNEIWWNGGDGSGTIGMGSYSGSHLTATSMFYAGPSEPMAQYSIFAVNAGGPGSITNSYASNMGDSAFYIGGCPDCNA